MAGQIKAGDLIVTDFGGGTVDDVNPTTGASFVIASGFSNPQGVAIDAQGRIFVSDIGTSTIDQVNPTTSVVTTFSGNGVGTGPLLDRPFEMTFFGSTLYVAEGGVPNGNTTAVYAIDSNGNRTLVAGNNGSSNNLFNEFLAGVAVDSKGHIFASAPTGGTVYAVSPGTSTPLTTGIRAPQGLAIGSSDQLLAVSGSPSNPLIATIDKTNGITTILSDNSGLAGTGPNYGSLRGITTGNGMIYVTDVGNDDILAVNPSNGNRTAISGNGVGGSTFGGLSYGIAVYPSLAAVPEASSTLLLALGGGILLGYGRWRGNRVAVGGKGRNDA
jgi:sugar lactone lactonase YvrE